QANNTISPASTAVGYACPTTPVAFTTTVNSSTSTTFTSVSTVTGPTTSFVTFTGAQAIPSATTTTLPAIDFNSKLTPRNDTIPYEALKVASDFKSITSKHGFSKCGGIMDINDFRILYSESQKTFIPLFKGRSPIVVNNATGRLYVQVYGTSVALEFDGIPCFGAKNASACTSDNVIDSGNTYNQKIAKTIGGALIKYGYFSLIESLGGYAILTIQTGPNDPYLACVMTKIADDDNIADSFVTPSATTAYTATSVTLGVVCLALAAGGVVTVATAGTGGQPGHLSHYHHSEHLTHQNVHHNQLDSRHDVHHNQLDSRHDVHHNQLDSRHDVHHNQLDSQPKEIHQGGDTQIQINHSAGKEDPPLNYHVTAKGDVGGKETDVVDHHVAGGGPPAHVQSPSFYDFIFYTQSIIATGWLSLNLTSEYRQFTSTFTWACAQGFINLNILVSAVNNLRYSICNIIISENTSIPGACVDQENGYTLPPIGSNASVTFGSNFSQYAVNPDGLNSYAHIIGIPVEDLPFTSMIGFLVVNAVAIVVVLLSAGVAVIVIKYRQNAPEYLKTLRDNVHLFLFALTVYQLSITYDCWMLLLLASIILAFIVFMHAFSILQISKLVKSNNILENDGKYKFVYSSLYNQFRPDEYMFHRISIIHTILRACVVGAVQVSGEVQLGGFFLIELFYLIMLIKHKPYADNKFGNYLNIILSVARIIVTLLLVPFVHSLSNFIPPSISKILSLTLIISQTVVLGSLGLMILSKLYKMLFKSFQRSGCRKSEANYDDE
ncbi:20114_t:CDS:2, partial [Dentiscutata erythropus]